MRKDVVELFAGVGGFRVGLNNIKEFDEDGIAIENRDWNFVWSNQWEPSTRVQHAFECYQQRFNLHESEDVNDPLYWCIKIFQQFLQILFQIILYLLEVFRVKTTRLLDLYRGKKESKEKKEYFFGILQEY